MKNLSAVPKFENPNCRKDTHTLVIKIPLEIDLISRVVVQGPHMLVCASPSCVVHPSLPLQPPVHMFVKQFVL